MYLSKDSIFCCVGLIVISAILPCSADENTGKSQPKIVATVDGFPIYERDVAVDPEEIDAFIARRQCEKLYFRIKRIMEHRAIQYFGIQATEDEVKKEIDSKMRQAGVDEDTARRIREIHRALLISLEQWQKDKTKSERIYDKYLKEYVSRSQWCQWQK